MGLSWGCARHPSDDEISNDINNKVSADPDTKDSQVKVATKDGRVTLSGQVKSPAAQQKLEQIARQEPGATGLEDETMVMPAPQPMTQPPTAQATEAVPAEHNEKPKPQPIVLPSGTVLTVRTSQTLSSNTSQAGQPFEATLAQPVSVGGRKALPAGTRVSGTVVTAKKQGKIKGAGELALALTSVSMAGHTYQIHTSVMETTEKGKGKRTAATTGGGAAGGALIGGLAGGGKGAAVGGLVGAGAGLAGGALTGNKQIELPAESLLSFTLAAPLRLPPPEERAHQED